MGLNKMKNKSKCNCEEISCKNNCEKNHTHKTFWCEKCHPERYVEEKSQSPIKQNWEEDYKKIIVTRGIEISAQGIFVIRDFIRSLLSAQSTSFEQKIKSLIVEEINIARSENEKTSCLTSLYNKVSNLLTQSNNHNACTCDINGAESDIGHFKGCPALNEVADKK